MKKIYFTTVIGMTLVLLSGCEKALEKTPDGQTTIDKVLNNFGQTKALRDVVYGEIYQARDQISFVHNTIEALTDNALWASTYNAYEWHNGSLSRSAEHTSELQSLMRISYAVFCLTKTKH